MSYGQDAILQQGQRRRRRRISRWGVLLVVLAVPALIFHRFLFLGNLAVVDPGRVYRSAQPRGNMETLIVEHDLASVLNLRGGSPRDWWYAEEVAACQARGVDFYDLQMSAEKRPSRRELLLLLDLIDQAEYPLLIHCKSGSDRTGLMAALYGLMVQGQSPEQAREAFSLWHGHVPLFGPERLHEPLKEYEAYLHASALAHTPARFRRWVKTHYRSEDPADDVLPPALKPGPRMALRPAG